MNEKYMQADLDLIFHNLITQEVESRGCASDDEFTAKYGYREFSKICENAQKETAQIYAKQNGLKVVEVQV
jgi:hypothetical protein